jgi:hypothetical protein
MKRVDEPVLHKPTSVDEVLQCLIIWIGRPPVIAFYEGSRECLNLSAKLIKGSIRALRKRTDLSRYTHALSRAIRVSQPDAVVAAEWRTNLRHLRALYYTSPTGSDRQRSKLLEIARNKLVVGAMRHALRQERVIRTRGIEPTWIAVLYAEGSKSSVEQADRFNALLDAKLQNDLRTYLTQAAKQAI